MSIMKCFGKDIEMTRKRHGYGKYYKEKYEKGAKKMEKKITTVVLGCGDRATVYCEEGVLNAKKMEIVAAIDPDAERLRYMQEHFGVAEEKCYHDMQDVLAQGRIADCVINGTMDQIHIKTAIPFLEQGYHMLMEKPITNNKEDLLKIRDTANENHCDLMICHVLRYAPFYRKAREIIDSGVLGEIMNIQTAERVGAFHSSVAFLRGKWADCGSSLLLAKCCHDIDLLCWLNSKTVPATVYSNGGRNYFVPKKAPKGAGTRCLVDCPEEVRKNCIYDVQSMYLDNCQLPWYPWQCTGKNWQDVTDEEKVESLKTYNPHGRCVYKCEQVIVDHQNVSITFEDGSTAIHTLNLGAQHAGRHLWIQGTKGELEGEAADGILTLYEYDKKTSEYKKTEFNFNETSGETNGHFGGDRRLINDFCDLIEGKQPSVSCTSINDSVWGHLTCYAGDKSQETGEVCSV